MTSYDTDPDAVTTSAEVTADLDFELYVADDAEMDALADQMSSCGLDAAADFELAAELFRLLSRSVPMPVMVVRDEVADLFHHFHTDSAPARSLLRAA